MIDREALLKDLQKEATGLEDDIRVRAGEDADTDARLRAQYDAAREAGRTAFAFEAWRDDEVTQAAVAWTLGCVFVRFLEDNGLLPEPRLSGPGDRRQLALDHRQLFFREHPTDTDREYLRDVFRSVAKLPAAGELLGEAHNPLWSLAPSADGAAHLLDFFQRILPETGTIAHDFTDPDWNTRFLGDLYQDLSEAARKKFALLQTPEFVEEFILDRTLTPAIEEFGYKEATLIDPTCGSGHFLLGAFHRLFELRVRHEPGTNPRELAQRALDKISGVDVNPFAIAIARFRLLLAALKVSDVERLADAPGFAMNLAAGDSLLHGQRFGLATMNLQRDYLEKDAVEHVFEAEDVNALRRILGRQHHAVVGNPPYITVKDKALNQAYRDAYSSCHMKYSLGVPFTERFFELAMAGDASHPAGFVGMITANSFMKREFGKKLIQETLPRLDLTHVIDTSGAYIPGHGTPTVILFGRNRGPVATDVRTVMGIRGEPSTPGDPARGQVWSAITAQLHSPGSESDFVSVADYNRDRFAAHPWSLGGGGAAELKELIEAASDKRLGDIVESIGITCFTLEDDLFLLPRHAGVRAGLGDEHLRSMVVGEAIRDWAIGELEAAVFPYSADLEPETLARTDPRYKHLWRGRTTISNNKMFGKQTKIEAGLLWSEYGRFTASKLRTPRSIAFAFVAPHNHFVLDRGGKVFNRSAPVIKLPPNASEDDHLALLALLNSSTACFWMKQVSQQKQLTGGDGVRVEFVSKVPYEFAGTQMANLPLPRAFFEDETRQRFIALGRELDEIGRGIGKCDPHTCVNDALEGKRNLEPEWVETQERKKALRSHAILLQEELDFLAYVAFGLCSEDLLGAIECPNTLLEAGMRPFEIRAQLNQDGFPVPRNLPETIGESCALIWAARIAELEENRSLRVIEDPHYKRRWIGRQGLFNHTANQDKLAEACADWLLGRLETPAYWLIVDDSPQLQTTSRLADRAAQDTDFMQVAELYEGHPDFDVAALVQKLALDEAVPALPACCYKPAGLRKRSQWERTWDLQRQEDAIDARTTLDPSDPEHLSEKQAAALKKKDVGDIPVPPKYGSSDFLKTSFWRLRGKLDVPKERFVSFPHCEREGDPSPVLAWAGWDHLQLARATAAYYIERKDQDAWDAARLTPLLATLAQLVPWLRQWHNDLDPEFGVGMGDYFAGFVDGQCQALGLTPKDLADWRPPEKSRKRRKKKTT